MNKQSNQNSLNPGSKEYLNYLIKFESKSTAYLEQERIKKLMVKDKIDGIEGKEMLEDIRIGYNGTKDNIVLNSKELEVLRNIDKSRSLIHFKGIGYG